jgi:ABC-type bacteriocin/lantibiotic exporter with double-glycine peptidase domain
MITLVTPLPLRRIEKIFTLQKDHSDCGVACLQNIFRFYGAEIPLERLRELSGTDKQGTTMLGLYQSAQELGFAAEGAEAEKFENISEVKAPCILHLTIDNRLLHYVVYYPPEAVLNAQPDKYLIGDTGRGVRYYTRDELEKVWVTKACLLLNPAEKLATHTRQSQDKWKWFWPILKENINLLYLAGFLGLLIALLNLSTAVFSQQLVDKILPAKDNFRLTIAIVLFALLLLMRVGLSYMRQFMLLRQSVFFNTRLTAKFLSSLLHLTKSFFDNRKTGDLISRLNDTQRIQQAVSYMIGEIGIQVLLIFVSIIFIFIYSWKIGIISIALIPLIFFIVSRFKKEIINKQKNLMGAHAHNESNYVDMIQGIGVVMSYNRQEYFLRKSQTIFSIFQGASFKLGRTKMSFTLLIELALVIFLTSVIGWSASLVVKGDLKTGELIAIIQMASMLFQNTTAVALTNIQLQEAKVAFDRMYEFSALDERKEQDISYEPLTGVDRLRVENLCFGFPGRSLLFENISFEVNRGEIAAIAGQSGSGKSTLLQIIHRLYNPQRGAIYVNGRQLTEIDIKNWRQNCMVSLQEVALFSGMVIENIMLDDQPEEAEKVIQFCKEYKFDQFFEGFPQSYATVLGEGGVNLSGGQKQLIGLARCLYKKPPVILLDEPTAAMDAVTEKFVIDLLRSMAHNTIIIVISHKDSLTSAADKVYSLQKGKLIKLPDQIKISAASFCDQ